MTSGTGPVVLVAGATGYLGRRLVGPLLDAGYRVRCLARTPRKLDAEPWRDEVEVVQGDVMDATSLEAAFEGVHAAYYLVHSIGAGDAWESRDRVAAENFRDAAAHAGIAQIVYLGGLGDERAGGLSRHLGSRHDVGRVLASGPVPVTELRAAVIIGSGSASFEMLRNLVEVLPAMVTPKWVDTRVQPIGVTDTLVYLVGVLDNPRALGRVLEIGGADVVTYREMMQAYAEVAGLRRRVIVPVPVLSPRLSSLWVGLVTPLPADLARPLIDSLVNEVVVADRSIDEVVDHEPLDTRRALALAVQRVGERATLTRWTDAELFGRTPADPMTTDPVWAGGKVLEDRQTTRTGADPAAVFAVVTSLGGEVGWLVGEVLWAARGLIDLLVGGVGMRRGRRHPTELRVGDVVDFWRVEELEVDRELRLRAEMKLPGAAWLQWTLTPDGEGCVVEQVAMFHPRGLWGRAYWYAVAPFHRLIFGPMLAEIVRRASVSGSAAGRGAGGSRGTATPG